MFSFHKPKVYRSTTGCCICKAKSSSSRFTDSKKYEEDFVDCFQLPEKRCGEVCNACVLLVKRWKKLPEGNGRNWRHVVDARAKSFTKMKSKMNFRPNPKRKSIDDDQEEPIRKKKPRKITHRNSCDERDEGSEESPEGSRSPTPSEETDDGRVNKRLSVPNISGFVDLNVWKMVEICCGTIFVGPRDAMIVDPRLVVPCRRRRHPETSATICDPPPPPPVPKDGAPKKTFSDASSDSGYDESSNQSAESTLSRQAVPQPLLVAN